LLKTFHVLLRALSIQEKISFIGDLILKDYPTSMEEMRLGGNWKNYASKVMELLTPFVLDDDP